MNLDSWQVIIDWVLTHENLPMVARLASTCIDLNLAVRRTPVRLVQEISLSRWEVAVDCYQYPDYLNATGAAVHEYSDLAFDQRGRQLAVARFSSVNFQLYLLSRPGAWSQGGHITQNWHSNIDIEEELGGRRGDSWLWVQILEDGSVVALAFAGSVEKRGTILECCLVVHCTPEGKTSLQIFRKSTPADRQIMPMILDGRVELFGQNPPSTPYVLRPEFPKFTAQPNWNLRPGANELVFPLSHSQWIFQRDTGLSFRQGFKPPVPVGPVDTDLSLRPDGSLPCTDVHCPEV